MERDHLRGAPMPTPTAHLVAEEERANVVELVAHLNHEKKRLQARCPTRCDNQGRIGPDAAADLAGRGLTGAVHAVAVAQCDGSWGAGCSCTSASNGR